MEVREINNKELWEDFFREQKDKTFLQSWNCGNLQEKMGNKIWRLGAFDNDGGLASVSLVVKIKAKRGTFLLVQHGPLGKKEAFNIFFGELKKIAKAEKASFIRVAPLLERNEGNRKLFKDFGFREAPMHANAYESTWKLDIIPSEEELLRNMRKTTRYLIRQTLKNQDITVEKSKSSVDVAAYQKLNKEVSKRQRFVPFSPEFIKNEFEVFSEDNQVLWLFGKYKGEVAAAALVVFWSGVGFYHQAASCEKYAKLSIPYLLSWEAVKEAKKRECSSFDFWGFVDPKTNPRHPWTGPTLFKMGFGGQAYEYLKTQDLPLSKSYWLIYIFEKIRSIKRGL